jgi:hypothetical protein
VKNLDWQRVGPHGPSRESGPYLLARRAQRGDLAAKEDVSKKKKAKEKQENIPENPPLPVLGVGVLTRLGECTLTPTRAGYTRPGTGYLVPVPILNRWAEQWVEQCQQAAVATHYFIKVARMMRGLGWR